MQTKPLLYGLIGFFVGGLLVAVAATTFDKPTKHKDTAKTTTSMSGMSMDQMTAELVGKTGDAYDKAFIANMIAHHRGAVVMAKLSAANAKHEEIKKLSQAIVTAQEQEIANMKQWQKDWGYSAASTTNHMSH